MSAGGEGLTLTTNVVDKHCTEVYWITITDLGHLMQDVAMLIISCFTIVQVLSTVAQARYVFTETLHLPHKTIVTYRMLQDGSTRLVGILRSIYDGVGLLQLHGLALPASCTSAYPFESDLSVICVAAACWLIAIVAWLFWQSSTVAHHVTYLCATAAVYLHPSASFSAAKLLDCRVVHLAASAAASLDGGDSAPAKQVYSTSATLVQVSVVAANPFFSCMGRVHAPAGYMAAATLLIYVAALPIVTFVVLWRDPWLAHALGRATGGKAGGQASPPRGRVSRRSSIIVVPMGDATTCTDAASATDNGIDLRSPEAVTPTTAGAASGAIPPAPLPDPLLYPFEDGSGYQPDAWIWRHIDLCVVCGLSVVNALLPAPQTLQQVWSAARVRLARWVANYRGSLTPATQVATKLATTLVLLASLAVFFAVLPNPYVVPWRRSVRLALLALSASCAAINAASRALDLGFGGPVLAATIAPGAYCIIGIFCATVASLLAGFARELLSKAVEDAERSAGSSGNVGGRGGATKRGPPTRLPDCDVQVDGVHGHRRSLVPPLPLGHSRALLPASSGDVVGQLSHGASDSPSPWAASHEGEGVRSDGSPGDMPVLEWPTGVGPLDSSRDADAVPVNDMGSARGPPEDVGSAGGGGAPVDEEGDDEGEGAPTALPGTPTFRARSFFGPAGGASPLAMLPPSKGPSVSSVRGNSRGPPLGLALPHRAATMGAQRSSSIDLRAALPQATAAACLSLRQKMAWAAAATSAPSQTSPGQWLAAAGEGQSPLPGSSPGQWHGGAAQPSWQPISVAEAFAPSLRSSALPISSSSAAEPRVPGMPVLRARRASCSMLPNAPGPLTALSSSGPAAMAFAAAGAPPARLRRRSFLLASASLSLQQQTGAAPHPP